MENGLNNSIKDLFRIEKFSSSRPFWLSPRQLAIVPVFPSLDGYANQIQKQLWDAGFQVECDLDAGTTLNKKIRNNQLAQYNFIGGTY